MQDTNVLIAPLWNWNKWASIWETKSLCSNRTFMELKYEHQLWEQNQLQSSNRTFMELKYLHSSVVIKTHISSNRTFMELKWRRLSNFLHTFLSSNRTFMELKLKGTERSVYKALCLNIGWSLWNIVSYDNLAWIATQNETFTWV